MYTTKKLNIYFLFFSLKLFIIFFFTYIISGSLKKKNNLKSIKILQHSLRFFTKNEAKSHTNLTRFLKHYCTYQTFAVNCWFQILLHFIWKYSEILKNFPQLPLRR